MQVFEYYSRPEIVEQLLKNAKDREVAGRFLDGTYDSRPNILQYPSDVIQMAKKGITSFHYSVERWRYPMQLREGVNYENLRIGWDLLIDMDSKIGIEGAQAAALLICNEIERYGIKNYGIKFSGSRGFHIIIPWECFPKEINYLPLEKQFPAVPEAIIEFIKSRISEGLMKELIKLKGAKELIDILEEPPERLDPFYFVDVEKWGNRHMFRAPYSLNEKTWLASVPITKEELKDFKIEIAKPEKIKIEEFLKAGEENEAANLLIDAMDFIAKYKKEPEEKKHKITFERKILESSFPPCIKNALKGLSDGRKRSIFILSNFLRLMNWHQDEIESKINEWNSKNKGPLPKSIINSALRWNMMNPRTTPNCNGDGRNSLYYSFICQPDERCKKIKNPISYAFKVVPRIKKIEYKCEVCNKGFSTMRSLNLHRSRIHGLS